MRMIIGTTADDANQLIADVQAWQKQVQAAGINVSVTTPTTSATSATAGSSTVTAAIQAVNAAGQAATLAGQNAMMLAQQAQMNPTLQQLLASSMIMQPNGTPLSAMGLVQLAQAATTAGQAATTLGQQGAALAANSDASSWLSQANTATTNANNAANAANQAAQQLQMMMSSTAAVPSQAAYGGGGGGFGGGGGGGFDGGGGGADDSGVDWGDDSGQGGGEDDYAAAQSMLDDVSAQSGGYDDSWVDDVPMDDGTSDFEGDDFSDVMIGKQVHPDTVIGVALAEARGGKLYRHVVGAIDVEGLKERFDTLDPTNHNVKMAWLDHGLALAQRATKAMQDILAKAIVPTNEFALHDSVIAFDNRAKALSDKVVALPDDDNKSPIWDEVRSYFIDGSNLVNQAEGVVDGSLKWSDVKESVSQMAAGVGTAASAAASTIKWTSVALVGGAVVLGGGILYALYKAITSDTGKAVAVTATRAALGR